MSSWFGDAFRSSMKESTWLGDNARFAREGFGEVADALNFNNDWEDYLFAHPAHLSNYFADGRQRVPDDRLTSDHVSDDGLPEDVLEADLLYGSAHVGDSLSPVVEKLEDRGHDVEMFDEDDIERKGGEVYLKGVPSYELGGKDMIWRRVGFVDAAGEWNKILADLEQLRRDGVRTLPTPRGAVDCDDKKRTKRRLKDRGVKATRSYENYEDVKEAQEEGKMVVEKPVNRSGGVGVRFLEPEDPVDFNPDNVYEEFVNHYDDPHTVERRAVVFTGDNVNQLVEVKNRELKEYDGVPRPKNISNNGSYSHLDLHESPLIDREMEELLDASEAMGGGLLGVDYTTDLRTGETTIIEVNSNVGLKGIREASNVDIYDELADSIGKELNDEPVGRTCSDHLEEVKSHGADEESLRYRELDEFEYLEPGNPDPSSPKYHPNKASTV